MTDELELTPTAMVAGGDALARDADGRVVFAPGALPGERVRVRIRQAKKQYARAELVEVLEPSSMRVEPPCPHVGRGCGGCQWQHIAVGGQRRLKREIVLDALRRIGKLPDPLVHENVASSSAGYRTTVRVAVVDGGAGFRRAQSNAVLDVDACLVTHPLLDELIRGGVFGEATEVELRAGARTGQRLALCDPSVRGVELPGDVVVIGMDEIARGATASIEEEIGGRRWRVSAPSFFQARPDGADALVALVLRAADDASTVVDLYSGVGLFAGVLGERGAHVVAVEGDSSAVADAHHNLAGLDADVIESDVHAWVSTSPADLVVADPSRRGLGSRGVEVVAACEPSRVVLVSCDPAALGRDAGLLTGRGYDLVEVTPVDLFPHTFHIETVSVFDRRE